jgi:hypothetical protein
VVVGFGAVRAGRAVVAVGVGPAAFGPGSGLLGTEAAGAFSAGGISEVARSRPAGGAGAVEVVVDGGGS